jgi:hypothetical protein
MQGLIKYQYIEDEPWDGTIELLDGTGDKAHKTTWGTYITYSNAPGRPIRHMEIVKNPGQRLMLQEIRL